MATLAFEINLTGGGVLTTEDVTGISTTQDPRIGEGNFDAIQFALDDGTASGQANNWFFDERTVTAATADNLDLAGSLTNPFGATLTFTVIKMILISIDAPDGTLSLEVGPKSVANAFQGPWGAASDFTTILSSGIWWNEWAGWTVTAGTGDILGINNPGAGSVTYRIWIIGLAS